MHPELKSQRSDRSPEDIFASLARSTRLDGKLTESGKSIGIFRSHFKFLMEIGSAHFSRPKTLNKKSLNGLFSKVQGPRVLYPKLPQKMDEMEPKITPIGSMGRTVFVYQNWMVDFHGK